MALLGSLDDFHGSGEGQVSGASGSVELSRYMGASVRVIEAHYAHLVPDAEEAARVKLDARAAVSVPG